MDRSPLDRAPNYTNATLVMGGVNLFWILVALWALWGWLGVTLVVIALNWAIDRAFRP